MKNYVIIGDLHAHAWPIFPTDQDYLGKVFDLLVNKVRLLDDEIQKISPGKTTVVVLGDLCEEPYKRGKLSIAVQNTLILALATLKRSTECDIAVIAGNHDMVSGGATWMTALGKDGAGCVDFLATSDPVVLPASHKIDGSPVILMPYKEPRALEASLADLGKKYQGSAVVCGHFAFSGTKYTNGAYDDNTGARISALGGTDGAWTYILGHNHTPGNYDTGKGGYIYYAGLPIPYNFGYQHAGQLLYHTPVGGYAAHVLDVPRFYGPVAPEQLAALAPKAGDFVRVSIAAHDKHTIETLKQRFVGVNISPCFEEVLLEAGGATARCSSAATLTDAGAGSLDAALSGYIKYQIAAGGCPFTEEDLLEEFYVVSGK